MTTGPVASTRPVGHPGQNESVSAGILRTMLENPIDQGYRDATKAPDRPTWSRGLAAVLIVVLVAASFWAAKDLRGARLGTTSAGALLRAEVRSRLATQDALESEIASLNGQIEELRSEVLPADEDLLAGSALLAAHAGSIPVRGPGIVITLDDSAALTADQRVQDFDLQVIVNALWASGAEAIAIDGQRLSTTTAIRNAGEAVLVNLTPLAGPYTVEAIGDPSDLQVQLARTRAAGHLAVLRDTYGVSVAIDAAEDLELAAAPSRGLEYAVPLEGAGEDEAP